MRCSKAEKLIQIALDGAGGRALDGVRERALDDHLAGCARCRAKRADYEGLAAALSGLDASAVLPPPSREVRIRRLVPFAAAAAIVLALAIAALRPEVTAPQPLTPGPQVVALADSVNDAADDAAAAAAHGAHGILRTVALGMTAGFSTEDAPAVPDVADVLGNGGTLLADLAAAGRDLGGFYRGIARELVPIQLNEREERS